ncbi:hypothetical protein ACFQH6_03730 [Halobacteriaceae archaeon GCM10025711]
MPAEVARALENRSNALGVSLSETADALRAGDMDRVDVDELRAHLADVEAELVELEILVEQADRRDRHANGATISGP